MAFGMHIRENTVPTARCTTCSRKIGLGSPIITQEYSTRFGGGEHKYCIECSYKGLKTLTKEYLNTPFTGEALQKLKAVKLKEKIGWDHY